MPSPEKFKKSLENFGIDEKVITQINEGYEDTVDKTPKKTRAAYFKRAVDIMTEQVDSQKLQDIFEWNACCKGGAREKASKAFAKENKHLSIDEKLEKIKGVSNMGEPLLNEDGTITVKAVSYSDGEKYLCACSNFNGLKYDYSFNMMKGMTNENKTYGKHNYRLSYFRQHTIVILSGIFIVVLYSVFVLWIYGYD